MITSNTHRACAALLLGAATASAALAGRPLQTEDAGVLEPRACELEGVSARLSDGDTVAREHGVQLGCGVGAATQLALAVSRAKADGASASGVRLGGKTELWQAKPARSGDEAAALTLAYGVLSAKLAGDRWRHASSEVRLVYSAPLAAELTLHANLGHARDEIGKQRSTLWGVAVEHAGFGPWAPMAELFGDDREPPWWNLGLRYTAIADKMFFDLSYGRQAASGRPSLATLGFKLAF